MSQKSFSQRDKMILNVCAGVGIVGGIVARRLSGAQGIVPGAIYGAAGALIGMFVGLAIIAILPKTNNET